MTIIHHHLILQSKVSAIYQQDKFDVLKMFLLNLVDEIEMECLIEPQLKFSQHKAWTGLIGIVTSHISFHYWTIESYLQLDIYSCKAFPVDRTIKFVDNFWKLDNPKLLFIEREPEKEFVIKNL